MAKHINRGKPSIVDHSIRIEIGHAIECSEKTEKLTVIKGSLDQCDPVVLIALTKRPKYLHQC